jgi:hypothetical protein
MGDKRIIHRQGAKRSSSKSNSAFDIKQYLSVSSINFLLIFPC